MSSNKFLQLARRNVQEYKALFDTLIEFEQTKRIRTKTRLNFTIDKTIASQFKKYCRNKGYNMSAKVEEAMLGIMK